MTVQSPPPQPSQAPPPVPAPAPPATTFSELQLQDIQGFGIAGFNKDYQESIFIRVGSPAGGKELLTWLQPYVANAWEVGEFNELFRLGKSNSAAERSP